MSYVCSDCVNIDSIKKEGVYSLENKLCFYCKENKAEVIERDAVLTLLKTKFLKVVVPFSKCSENEQLKCLFFHSEALSRLGLCDMIEGLEFGSKDFEDDFYNEIEKILGIEDDQFVYDDGRLDKGNKYEVEWYGFIQSIHHRHRFFNHNSKPFLDSLFSLIHEDGEIIDTMIYELNPSIPIFRARIANTEEQRTKIYSNPASELGAAPANLAENQRMTPTGISAFYASDSRETCFSEVRATTGDMVMSAEFRAANTLRLLDLSKLEKAVEGNFCPFDEEFVDKSHKFCFIQKLVFLLSKPASQRKDSVYLETQVIFEYFRTYFAKNIHGIAFNSVQNGMEGMNIALFPEYSKVNLFSYNKRAASCDEYFYQEEDFYFYVIKGENEDDVPMKKNGYLDFVDHSIELHCVKAVKTITKNFNIHMQIDGQDQDQD